MESKLQPLVNLLLSEINELGQSGNRPVNASALFAHFAFDAMGIINVSEPFGFLQKRSDVSGAIQAIDMANTYFSVIAQAPWMHGFLLGNRVAAKAMADQNPVLNMALAMVDKRLAAGTANEKNAAGGGTDFLGRLLETNSSSSSKGATPLRYEQIVSLVLANTMAGYATVAIATRSILYLLARHPKVYARLQQELDTAVESGTFTHPPPNHAVAEAAKLPYLDAVIVEALRVHPVLGLILEREVPEGGAELAGRHIPEGTIVGFNPWVILHNRDVYGEDADVFRPERWLEADEARLKEMKRCNISVSPSSSAFFEA